MADDQPFQMLEENPAVERHDHSSLRHMVDAGGPLYRAGHLRAIETPGPVLVRYSGLGEVTGNITVLPPNHHHCNFSATRLRTCGFARTGVQVQIQGRAGKTWRQARPARMW